MRAIPLAFPAGRDTFQVKVAREEAERQDGSSQIYGGRGRPPLVVHNPHHWLRFGQPQHRAYEIVAVGTVDPRGAYHDGARTDLEYCCFARKFRRAINVQWSRGVVLTIRRLFAAVENVVCRDMDEGDATSCCRIGKQRRSTAIYPERAS